jgi:hypothetical protein
MDQRAPLLSFFREAYVQPSPAERDRWDTVAGGTGLDVVGGDLTELSGLTVLGLALCRANANASA